VTTKPRRTWFISEWDAGGCVKCGAPSRGDLSTRMMFCGGCDATETDRCEALRVLKSAGFKPAGRLVMERFGRFMSEVK
jgi:hypothetical protein